MWRTHHFFSVSCLFAQLQGSATRCPPLRGALRRQWGWRVSAGGCSRLLAGAWGFFLSFPPRKSLSLCILLSLGYQSLSSHLLGLADLSCHHPASYFDSGSQKAAHPPHSSPTTPPHLLGPPKEEEEKRFRKKYRETSSRRICRCCQEWVWKRQLQKCKQMPTVLHQLYSTKA